ncbi:MAG: hypothetical protein QOD78_358 [Chloroflexota bacterium]|jgi:hypothetical protein|nr:hypothetical protein [Chloroflexota bacterium]MEA2612149.1 hypothetical protein [Chloroflexota bacterium]
MTQLTQTRPTDRGLMLAGVALAASLLGGIVGGVVVPRVESIVQSNIDATAARAAAVEQAKWDAYGADWLRLNQATQSRYPTAHDQAVLKAAQDWEARSRQMYPTTISAHDQAVLKAAQDWEARYRQMYPAGR